MSWGQFSQQTESWADAPTEEPRHESGGNDAFDQGDRNRFGSSRPPRSNQFDRSDRDQGRDRDRDERRPPPEPLPIPTSPPFIAFVGNISFQVQENDLRDYFQELCQVEQVRIVRDVERRSKGFGYVHFVDRESLELALTANGVDFQGRSLKVDVASQRDSRSSGGDSEADTGPWRRGEKVPFSADRGNDRGGAGRGGDDFGRREGGGDVWRRGAPPPSSNSSAPAARPKLDLKPRSAPAPTEGAVVPPPVDYSKAKSNPFGSAKPRDEAAYERKKEEERQQRGGKSEGSQSSSADGDKKSVGAVQNRFAALSAEND
eukprot:c12135_g1_i1.p1 GENE.c12135_g1_i1~~c12135_g1_i1.p1  ORF type:complete len:341 (+),score=35.56 c12135_g1_i1:73-1023(+)